LIRIRRDHFTFLHPLFVFLDFSGTAKGISSRIKARGTLLRSHRESNMPEAEGSVIVVADVYVEAKWVNVRQRAVQDIGIGI